MHGERKTKVDSDALGQLGAVGTLRRAVEAFIPPGCVALYGPWGSGKTSILHTVYEAWDGPRAWFDPWQYAQRGDVLTPMLLKITHDLGLHETSRWGETKRLVMGATKTMLSIAARGALGFAFGGGLDAALDNKALAGVKVEDFEAHFEQVKATVDEIEVVKGTFKKIIDAALEGYPPDKNVLICLDDLDRCLPDDVVAMIEAVKLLLAGATGCRAVFVFALDRRIVGEAIKQRYPGATQYTGENYLEKVFDLCLEVPPVPGGKILKTYCEGLIGDLSAEPVFGKPDEFATVLSNPCLANPRVILRSIWRLQLLLGAPGVREVLEPRLSGRPHATTRKRFLAWLAGAERFREFRQWFSRASTEQLNAASRIALGEEFTPLAESLAAEMPILRSTDFAEFHQLLLTGGQRLASEKSQTTWATVAELAALDQEVGLSMLSDFDRLMRLVGV